MTPSDTSPKRPLLSLVVPAYNEAAPDRLPKSLREITAWVATQEYAIEVVIVNNNSNDGTLAIAEAAAVDHDYIRVLTEKRQGKGGSRQDRDVSRRRGISIHLRCGFVHAN